MAPRAFIPVGTIARLEGRDRLAYAVEFFAYRFYPSVSG
jgi:hypothetical protein